MDFFSFLASHAPGIIITTTIMISGALVLGVFLGRVQVYDLDFTELDD